MVNETLSRGAIAAIVNNTRNLVPKYAIPLQMLIVGNGGCRSQRAFACKGVFLL